MLQVCKNNHCSLIKAALICGESKESQKQHLLQDTLAQPKSLQVIYVSYLTSFCSSSCFLTCLFGYVDARHLRAATSQRRRSTVRRRCYLLLLLGYWWGLGGRLHLAGLGLWADLCGAWHLFGNRHKVHLANQDLAFLERLAGKCGEDAASGFAQGG